MTAQAGQTGESPAGGETGGRAPGALELRFGGLRADGAVAEEWRMLLRIVGDFSVHVDGAELYAESEFCVVELAAAAAAWLREGAGADFVFTSMEAEEAGLVRIEKRADGWRVGSVHQRFEGGPLELREVERALAEYVHRLASEVRLRLGIDISPVLERSP